MTTKKMSPLNVIEHERLQCKIFYFTKHVFQVDNGDAPSTKVGGGGKQKSIVEIYTDWANHYLEKTRGKHKIRCLQTELVDGLLLAEVIEAVTHQKVPDITKKPKNRAAMVTNIQACLNFLLAKGVAVEEIAPEEVHDGNLKAILGLFFQLSRCPIRLLPSTLASQFSLPSSL